MDKELNEFKEELKQFYSVKDWVENEETENFFDFLRKTRFAFLQRVTVEPSVEKIRWYQGIIQVMDLMLLYPETAMDSGEILERQKYDKENI